MKVFRQSALQIHMKSRFPYFLTAILAITYLAACDSGPENSEPQLFALPDTLFTEVDDGLRYAEIKFGQFDGPVVETDIVFGTTLFWLAADSSFIDEVEFVFEVGTPNPLTEGWARGLLGMHEGGLRQVIVPPNLAFGSEGFPAYDIPPNATLIYEINLRQRDEGAN